MNIAVTAPSYLLTDTYISSEGYTVYEICRRLAARGHRIFIAAPEVRLTSPIPNTSISELGPTGIMPLTNPARELSKWWIFSLRTRSWLRRLVEKEDIDIVHHFFPSTPGDFSLVADIHPAFIFGPQPLPHEGLLPEEFVLGVRRRITTTPLLRMPYVALRNRLYSRTLQHARRVLVQVASVVPYVRRADSGSSKKVDVVPLGVDTKRFSPEANEPEQTGTILFVGGLTRIKGLDFLIEAMPRVVQRHPHARLVIVGDGPDRQYFQRVAIRTGCRSSVDFLGFIPRDKIQAQYAKCSIFCLPSLAESFSLAILEAMSCAKPIVATAVGAIPSVAADIALLVPPRNPERLAYAINQFLGDPQLRRSTGQKGRKRVLGLYDWDIITDRVEGIYEHCAARS